MNEASFEKKDGLRVISWLSNLIQTFEENKGYKIEVKEAKKKRSLSANSYCWILLDKLATKLQMSKTELYKTYIKEIGGVSDVVCVKNEALDKLRSGWEHNGLGWQTETTPSKIEGCTNVILYYGSSTYDTKQMSDLINLIVQDCKENDIETLAPQEVEKIIEAEKVAEKN